MMCKKTWDYWLQHQGFIKLEKRQNDTIAKVYDDVMASKPTAHYLPFIEGNPRSPVDSPHIGPVRPCFHLFFRWSWLNAWWQGTPSSKVCRNAEDKSRWIKRVRHDFQYFVLLQFCYRLTTDWWDQLTISSLKIVSLSSGQSLYDCPMMMYD